MSLIKGIHHVALRPTYAQFEKAKTFYLDLLGLKVVRQWGDEKYPCILCLLYTSPSPRDCS
mgnify:CR=1 FL=1